MTLDMYLKAVKDALAVQVNAYISLNNLLFAYQVVEEDI